jgi:small subunit ribosomal protein S1
VREVDAKGATVDLGDGIEGYVRANDIAKERVEDATQHLKVGDKIEAKFIGMDRKGRTCCSSRSGQGRCRDREAMDEYNKAAPMLRSGTTKLGALLREQLGGKSERESGAALRFAAAASGRDERYPRRMRG